MTNYVNFISFYLKSFILLFLICFFLKSILIHGQDRNVKEVIPLLSLPFQSKLGFRTSASCIKDVSDLS